VVMKGLLLTICQVTFLVCAAAWSMNLKRPMLNIVISASVIEFLTSLRGKLTELRNRLSYFLVLFDRSSHSIIK
jgi:hypothetical protein